MKYCWMLWPESWRGSCIFTSFHFPDSGLFLLNGFDFYFDLFWKAWYWKPAIKKQRKVVLATYGRFCDESVHYWPVKIKLKCSRFFFGHCTVIIYFFYFFKPCWISQLGPAHCAFVERRLLFGSVPLHLATSRTVSLRNTSRNHAYFEVCTLLHTRHENKPVILLPWRVYLIRIE